jgi:hypothetical protein
VERDLESPDRRECFSKPAWLNLSATCALMVRDEEAKIDMPLLSSFLGKCC